MAAGRKQANGIAYLEALPAEPSSLDPVLCVHGFPVAFLGHV